MLHGSIVEICYQNCCIVATFRQTINSCWKYLSPLHEVYNYMSTRQMVSHTYTHCTHGHNPRHEVNSHQLYKKKSLARTLHLTCTHTSTKSHTQVQNPIHKYNISFFSSYISKGCTRFQSIPVQQLLVRDAGALLLGCPSLVSCPDPMHVHM